MLEAETLEWVRDFESIKWRVSKCPISGTSNWSRMSRQFQTWVFSYSGGFLCMKIPTTNLPKTKRPHKLFFVNFPEWQKTARMKSSLLGIAQDWKANFDNETSLVRSFSENAWVWGRWRCILCTTWYWVRLVSENGQTMRDERGQFWHLYFLQINSESINPWWNWHIMQCSMIIESWNLPFWIQRMEGIHSRTDFDL